MGYIKLVT